MAEFSEIFRLIKTADNANMRPRIFVQSELSEVNRLFNGQQVVLFNGQQVVQHISRAKSTELRIGAQCYSLRLRA